MKPVSSSSSSLWLHHCVCVWKDWAQQFTLADIGRFYIARKKREEKKISLSFLTSTESIETKKQKKNTKIKVAHKINQEHRMEHITLNQWWSYTNTKDKSTKITFFFFGFLIIIIIIKIEYDDHHMLWIFVFQIQNELSLCVLFFINDVCLSIYLCLYVCVWDFILNFDSIHHQ